MFGLKCVISLLRMVVVSSGWEELASLSWSQCLQTLYSATFINEKAPTNLLLLMQGKKAPFAKGKATAKVVSLSKDR